MIVSHERSCSQAEHLRPGNARIKREREREMYQEVVQCFLAG